MNIHKLAPLALFTLSLALVSGCSSLKKKTATDAPAPAPVASAPAAAAPAPKAPVLDEVTIRSMPSGATVVINGSEVGTTPLVATVDRAKTYTLTVKQAGYNLSSQVLQAHWMLFKGTRMPGEVSVKLTELKDPVKSLETAVSNLDGQLKGKSIDAAQYKQLLAEVTRFYSQSK